MAASRQHGSPLDPALTSVQVCQVRGVQKHGVQADAIAVEEPLEIRLSWQSRGQRIRRVISVTMRTPGHDAELAAGYLFAEGVLADPGQMADIRSRGAGNVICVELREGMSVALTRLERHFATTSSCGQCGKASLEAIRITPNYSMPEGQPLVDAAIVHALPEKLRAAQPVFERTGGLHAAALFNPRGRLLCLREDVGRHNAVDKLIGTRFLEGNIPGSAELLLVSGRTSFELVQKAAMAGIPILAAIGAPSSLAVELAKEHGLTLLGFVRHDQFNIYAGAERICQSGGGCVPGNRGKSLRIAASIARGEETRGTPNSTP